MQMSHLFNLNSDFTDLEPLRHCGLIHMKPSRSGKLDTCAVQGSETEANEKMDAIHGEVTGSVMRTGSSYGSGLIQQYDYKTGTTDGTMVAVIGITTIQAILLSCVFREICASSHQMFRMAYALMTVTLTEAKKGFVLLPRP